VSKTHQSLILLCFYFNFTKRASKFPYVTVFCLSSVRDIFNNRLYTTSRARHRISSPGVWNVTKRSTAVSCEKL